MESSIAAAVNGMATDDFWFAVLGTGLLCLIGFWWWFRSLKRLRLIEDTPTSRCRSAAQGYCELVGRQKLMPGEPIRAPLTGRHCTWWSYKIEEHRYSAGRSNQSRWVTIEQASSDSLFLIEDETGTAVIDPDGAEVIASEQDCWYGSTARPTTGPRSGSFSGDYRYTEERMHEADELYAIGHFQSQSRQYSALDRQNEMAALLREWKGDKEFMRRFDSDKDGEISIAEWQQAREQARRIIEQRAREAALDSDINLMLRPPDGRPYILSVLPQTAMAKRYRWHSISGLAGFFIGGAICVFLLATRLAL